MSREKQIEEKSCEKCLHYCACLRNSEYYPEKPCFAYEDKAGYRKQSENTVEVIRCKDCKHWKQVNAERHACYKLGFEMDYDEYCSYGEAKMKGGAE